MGFELIEFLQRGCGAAPHFKVGLRRRNNKIRGFSPQSHAPKFRLIRCYAVRAQHHLSLSRLRGRTTKIGHPNGVPDPSLQINYIVDDLVPQSFANALMI